MGQHQGIMFYTIGQRKGLGITAASPLYVTAIEPERNAVIVGTKEQTYASELVADNLNWIADIHAGKTNQGKSQDQIPPPGSRSYRQSAG